MLSKLVSLRRFCENVEDTEQERWHSDGINAFGARERSQVEVDLES